MANPGIVWKRPTEFETHPSLFGHTGRPEVATSHQGDLGDCWFLAAATALAEKPERIQKLFITKEYAENGTFQTQFYVGGEL